MHSSSSEGVEAALIAKIDELSFIRTLNDRLAAASDFAAACHTLVELVWEERHVDAAAYVSIDRQRRACQIEAVIPLSDELVPHAALDLGDPLLAPLLQATEPVTLSGVVPPAWLAVEPPGAVLIGTPLRVRGDVTGVLLLATRGDDEALEEDRRLLAIVSTTSALALDVSRKEARAAFLAMLRHDITNPVAVAIGYTEMLVEGLEARADTDLAPMAKSALDILRAVSELIANYLHMAAVDRGAPVLDCEAVDLARITAEVVERLRPSAAEKGLEVRCALAPARAYGDRRQLDRIISNLVGNAIKYTPAGRVEVATVPGDGRASVRVSDTGYGLAEPDLHRLFTRYARFHRDKGIPGSGLGLHLTKALVDAHGGTIVVASTPGRGSTFTVTLPEPVDE